MTTLSMATGERTGLSSFAALAPAEAAALVHDGQTVAFSGFTPSGAAKAVPLALAERARHRHAAGESFRVRVLTGASTGPAIDDALAEAEAISWRAPYQSGAVLRRSINEQRTCFVDMHLSHLPQMVEFGFFGAIDVAVVEAVDVHADGRIFLSSSVGATPTYLRHAGKIVVEVNHRHSSGLVRMHDIATLPRPPHREPIPIRDAMTRIGTPYVAVDPRRIAGVVETDELDGVAPFSPPDAVSDRIAANVLRFLAEELRAGRIPPEFLPLQAGVGNVANAVMAAVGRSTEIPRFYMYTEVFQDSLVELMEMERLLGASATSLTLSNACLERVYGNMGFFANRIVLRPQELSNNPGVIRRLGVIAINTALEVDIYGHANSTHVCGTQLVNGIGGSGDFMRNAYLAIFVAPSAVKDGRISTIVPMCSHVDHNEHTVQIVVTEQGVADLRGLGPIERARVLTENCAHPRYRDYLRRYVAEAPLGHLRQDLTKCFELHRNLLESGAMLP
jgi:acetyl-CoA hydrolase